MEKVNFDISPLANREFLLGELKKSAFQKVFNLKKRQKPFITVSREPGSGGQLIAKRLAQHLHFKFYDEEILNRMFKNKAEEREYKNLYDEKDISALDEFVTTMVYPTLESQDRFVEKLVKTIVNLTLKGNCVILGRGANFFTDHKFGFHVRITAPFGFRVEKTVKFEHLSQNQAAEKVKTVSRERKKFVKKYFVSHIDNSEYYDLVLNMAHFSLDDATNLILNAFKKKVS